MKTNNKTLTLFASILAGSLVLSSCQNEQMTNNMIESKCVAVTKRNLSINDLAEDEICLKMGQWHNDGVDYVINRMTEDNITFFQYYGSELDSIVENYLSDFYYEITDAYPDLYQDEIQLFNHCQLNEEHLNNIISQLSYEAQCVYVSLENACTGSLDSTISALNDLYYGCNGIQDEYERIMIKSAIAVGISSYDYWTYFDYSTANDNLTPEELFPYLPENYLSFSSATSAKIKKYLEADFRETYLQAALFFGFYPALIENPYSAAATALIASILGAKESFKTYERDCEIERLQETPTDSNILYDTDGKVYNYLRSVYYHNNPEYFSAHFNSRFNFLIPYF